MKTLKVSFGTAKGVRLRNVRHLQWENAYSYFSGRFAGYRSKPMLSTNRSHAVE